MVYAWQGKAEGKINMRNSFNQKLFILGIGILQPVRPDEVIQFLGQVFPDISQWPDQEQLTALAEELEEQRYIHCVSRKNSFFSLTYMANLNMDKKVRYFRDKVRLSLLNEVYEARIESSDVVRQDLGGASPSLDTSSTIQDDARPESSGLESSRAEATRLQTRAFWSRISEQQKIFKVGLDSHPSDDSLLASARAFRYYSFPTLKVLQKASIDKALDKDMSATQLALCIGISPRLISSFTHKTENHYRRFSIPKKTGGEREIASPRFFLKTVQYWIKDYFLWGLKIHPACHAYLPGRSIQSNAVQHVQQNFVANIDIEDFFGSITTNHVNELLKANGIGTTLAHVIAHVLTLDECLPQGAPTSPVISNAFLYQFDCVFTDYCLLQELVYTRYADDITISGNTRKEIEVAIGFVKKEFKKYGVALKDKKTRIASKYASQRVTGLVVNEHVLPPREYRRKVRAIFHKADLYPLDFLLRLEEMKGHVSYLSSFEGLKNDKSIVRYMKIIRKLTIIKSKQ